MATILMYHGVDQDENTSFNTRFFSAKHFEEHLIFYKKNYNIITVAQAFNPEFINDKSCICLTFDDGYVNNLTYAYPLLVKHKVPAAIYITAINSKKNAILWADLIDIATPYLGTQFSVFSQTFTKNEQGKFPELKKFIKQNPIGGTIRFQQLADEIFNKIPNFRNDKKFDDYWKLLTAEQIEFLSKDDLITIGSHAYWHNNLANIDTGLAKKELADSVNYLKNIIKKDIDSIAFPDGSYNDAVIDFCLEQKIHFSLGSHYLFSENQPKTILQHRLGLYPPDDIDAIKLKIENYNC